jgi:hypothetical protein
LTLKRHSSAPPSISSVLYKTVLDNVTAPEWVMQVLMLFIIIGFPVAMIFAWAFEMMPEGIKREHEVDRTVSITGKTGRKLDFICQVYQQ